MVATVSFLIVVRHDALQLVGRIAEVQDYVDEIIVVHDGKCEDETAAVARRCGAKVTEATYEGYCEPQRMLGLAKCSCDWVLVGDADEVFEPKFLKNLRGIIGQAEYVGCDGVALGRLEYNMEPSAVWRHVRLFKRTAVILSDVIHSGPKGLAKVLKLDGFQFVHYSVTDGPGGDPEAVHEKNLRYDAIQERLRVKYADRPEVVEEFLSAAYDVGDE